MSGLFKKRQKQILRQCFRSKIDLTGILASGACLLHCLVTPSLILLGPLTLLSLFKSPLFHSFMFVVVSVIGFFYLVPRLYKRQDWMGGAILLFGWLSLLVALFEPMGLHWVEIVLTGVGSIALICVHIRHVRCSLVPVERLRPTSVVKS